MSRRDPDIKLDFTSSGFTAKQAEEYGRNDSAAWRLFQVIPATDAQKEIGAGETVEKRFSDVFMRRDELLRDYESFGSYPLIARPR